MNYLLLIAGILSLMATIGHFAIGTKDFLKPVLNSSIDDIPKKVMHSIFHYLSVFMILTTVVLLMVSISKCVFFADGVTVVKFIGVVYAGFAVVQLIVALTSGIKGGVFKLFQWVFWVLIAIFSLLGAQ
jgi:hypothetical protein